MIWGRLIGAILGFKLLGILGGIIGFFIGSWFDRGLRLHLHHIPRERSTAVQQAFFTATFGVMGHLAKADGRISEPEIRVAEKIMAQLELNEPLKQEAIRLFSLGKDPSFDLNNVLSALYHECGKHPDLLRFFIEIQIEAALADGELQSEEQRILLLICKRLNFPSEEFDQLFARQWASQGFYEWFSSQFHPGADQSSRYRARYSSQYGYREESRRMDRPTDASLLKDAYGVLGVPPTSTPVEIKKAYRKLMNQHHPDKLAARGLPEGMMKLAKEKTQQIRAAYDLLRAEHGFR